jgi:hypothetical protein
MHLLRILGAVVGLLLGYWCYYCATELSLAAGRNLSESEYWARSAVRDEAAGGIDSSYRNLEATTRGIHMSLVEEASWFRAGGFFAFGTAAVCIALEGRALLRRNA